MKRLAAAFTVLAMLAAAVASAHAPPMPVARALPANTDLCAAGAGGTPAPGAPSDDRGHACDRCNGCLGTGAVLPPGATAATMPRPVGAVRPPALPLAMSHTAPAAPRARGPPAGG